ALRGGRKRHSDRAGRSRSQTWTAGVGFGKVGSFWSGVFKAPIAMVLAPLLVNVAGRTFCVPTAILPNTKLEGVNCTAVPVPCSSTVCGLLAASSVTFRRAARFPIVAGAKITEMLHEPPGERELPQLLLPGVKSAALVPVMLTPEMFRGLMPLLLRVVVKAEVGTPTVSVPKARLSGQTWSPGTNKVTNASEFGVRQVLQLALKDPGLVGKSEEYALPAR